MSWRCCIGPSSSLLVAKHLRKTFLKSSQLWMFPFESLVYHTSTAPLKVKWKALYFIVDMALLKLTWVLKSLRCFTGSPLTSYIGIFESVKWWRTWTFLISCESGRLSSSSARSQDLCSLSKFSSSLTLVSRGGWNGPARLFTYSAPLSRLFLGEGLML